jgi:hypothetical protein
MNSHIYIHTDGTHTKIGITTDLDKRMASYKTHNPNSRLYKDYSCSIDEARRVETAIKSIFKNKLSGAAKEWFEVKAEEMDKYVSTLLGKHDALEKRTLDILLPSMHGVKLTNEAWDIKQEIIKGIESSNISGKEIHAKKADLAEIFATNFDLGMPEHRLPENIIWYDHMCIDLNHAVASSSSVKKSVSHNITYLPNDSHVWQFYHLVKLSSGFNIAICTARVSMPYLEAIEADINKQEMVDIANEHGLYCTFHNEWSWHYPDATALVLYQPKIAVPTLLSLWEKSFRKWVIERKEMLIHEPFHDRDLLSKTIEDTVGDNAFPLDITTYEELMDKYLTPYVGIHEDEEYPFWMKEAYIYLIDKWKAKIGL